MFSKNVKILVIDDMKTMRMVMKKCLKQLGYENIEEADDGESAWPLFQQAKSGGSPFQLILSDWNMPKMKGIELLEKIRQIDKEVPFVMVTAESEKSQVVEAIQKGVTHYITKPFTKDTVEERLGQVYQKVSG